MEVVGIYLPRRSTRLSRPLVACLVQAGFPSPAQDEIARRIDLNRDLIRHEVGRQKWTPCDVHAAARCRVNSCV